MLMVQVRFANHVIVANTKVNQENLSVYHVFQALINLKQRKRIAHIVQLIPTPLKQSERSVQTVLTTSIPIQAKRFVKNVQREKRLLAMSVDLFTAFSANQVKRMLCLACNVQTVVPVHTTTQKIRCAMDVFLESGAMLKD